ncbi:MAG: uracil-DNA glycosylase [Vampirovibrionales bacterium]|nr:uracil-DNA glycosylase [Vampirovibrionales bacterium]
MVLATVPPTQPKTKPALELSLHELSQVVATCTACRLCDGRIQTVFADGPVTARLMVIGEGPGQQEDEQGLPFVGRSGQLLTQILASGGFHRASQVGMEAANVYIANIVKCRPPQNRAPVADEMAACKPYLEEQIRLIQPALILLAGATAVKGILTPQTAAKAVGITKIRGQWFPTPYVGRDGHPIPAMPIFHPAYLLRNPVEAPGSPKALMWDDIQTVRQELDRRLALE